MAVTCCSWMGTSASSAMTLTRSPSAACLPPTRACLPSRSTTSGAPLPHSLMRRWLLLIGISLLIMGTTYVLLHPPRIDAGSHKYKFMHCDRCGVEMAYSENLAGAHCLRCKVERGKLTPTERSLNEGGSRDPWRAFNIALSFECVFLLWAVVWLLHHPPKPKEREYLFTN